MQMKTKVILAAIILFTGFVSLQAQKSYRRVSFGFGLQPHVSWFHADEAALSKGPVRLGIEGGLRLDFALQRLIALSVGVNLNQTGGNIIYNESQILDLDSVSKTVDAGTRVTYRLQFIEVPIAIKLMLPEIGYSTWFAEIGLDPMFNSSAYINATDNNIQREPFQQGVSRFNLAWHSGLGINYSLGRRMSLQFALMYKNSFLDMTRENDIRDADNVRINQVGLKMGILF